MSASGSYLHKTLLAASAQGLRNLMKISSLASLDGYYRKWPRMDDELLEQYHEGIIATTGCPSGAVQTRLRLGQYDEALKVAGKYQDIFGKENYFLELMDHGIPIETAVRDELLRIAKHLGIPPLATNDSHYVTEDQAGAHDALLCVGTNSQVDDPTRFRFSGAGYYLRTADEMRALNSSDEWAEACRNTLLIAERVESYKEVFAHRDLAAKFPVPDGETEMTWLRKEAQRGAVRRYGAEVPSHITERIEFELGVIEQMGFPGYFLVVADICKYARDNQIAIGPGRGSATGSMVSYVTGITELDPIEHSLLFERFLNPERISMPDVDLDFDERRRGDMIRYVTERYGEDNVSLIITYMTIKSKAAVKDANRILGYPFAIGEKITKAFPPAVQGKEIPLAAIFDEDHDRHAEAGELRSMYADDPDVKKVIDTARGIEGLIRGTGVHAAGVILSSEPLVDVMPIHRRADDGARITGFDGPSCEYMGSLKMDFLGLRNLTVISDAVLNVKANRGIDVDMLKLPLDDAKAYELLAAGKTLGVFQLDSTMMRDLTKLMAPGPVRGHLGRPRARPPGPDGSQVAHQLRAAQERPAAGLPGPPGAEGAARGDPRRDLPPGRLPRAGHGHRAQARRVHPGRRRHPAAGDGQEEERGDGQAVGHVLLGDEGQRLLRGGHPGGLGRAAAVLRLRVQQVPHRRVRARLLLDRLPQGELPRRVHGRPADLGRHQQGQDGRLPGRDPPDGRQGAAARRERVAAAVRRRRRRHQVRARRDPQRGRERRRRHHLRPHRPGQVRQLQRLPDQGAAPRLQQAGGRIAGQGRRASTASGTPARA